MSEIAGHGSHQEVIGSVAPGSAKKPRADLRRTDKRATQAIFSVMAVHQVARLS